VIDGAAAIANGQPGAGIQSVREEVDRRGNGVGQGAAPREVRGDSGGQGAAGAVGVRRVDARVAEFGDAAVDGQHIDQFAGFGMATFDEHGGAAKAMQGLRLADLIVDGRGDGLLSVFAPHATAGLALMELGSGSEADRIAKGRIQHLREHAICECCLLALIIEDAKVGEHVLLCACKLDCLNSTEDFTDRTSDASSCLTAGVPVAM